MECSGFHGRGAVEMDRGKCCVADMDGRFRDLLCYGLCEVDGMELSGNGIQRVLGVGRRMCLLAFLCAGLWGLAGSFGKIGK